MCHHQMEISCRPLRHQRQFRLEETRSSFLALPGNPLAELSNTRPGTPAEIATNVALVEAPYPSLDVSPGKCIDVAGKG